MAPVLKRKREAISYKEPSSDEDFSDDSDHPRRSRKQRSTPQRRSARHQQTEDERSPPRQLESTSPRAAASTKRDKRRLRGKRRVSYRESSSDDDNDDEFDTDFEVKEVSTPRKRPRANVASTPRTRSRGTPRAKRSRRELGAPLKTRTARETPNLFETIISDGNIPPWSSLPYHVLLQIFVYAAHPLHDENMTPTASIPWLAQTARICSTFTKPALTALYRNPPVFATKQNRSRLVHHLISPPAGAYVDYPVMVKRLELDATRMTKLTDVANSISDLVALLTSLKTLRELEIFDPYDKPPYRESRIRRWHYPEELFNTLRENEHRLWSWRWNSAYCEKGILGMKEIHTADAFQSLREVILTKYHPKPEKEQTEGEPSTEELLGSALAVLPNLRSLTFESCSVVNERLLPLLPETLVALNITNCRELISDALNAFLVTHGARLEELVLNHNQSLNLSFLVDLKRSCPRLDVLRMDMHYYSSLSSSSDNEPLYDELLPEGEIPSWPSTLRILDLEFLRERNPTSAIAFFTSLMDAAEELPWLRELVITAMVDVDWRQRAEFRKKWTARFQKVFARRSVPPSPHLTSIRAFREWKASNEEPVPEKNDSLLEGVDEDMSKQNGEESDSDRPLLPVRRPKHDEKWDTKRLRSRAKASTNYDESSSNESESDDYADDESIKFIQARCHTVVFMIDNSRPQETIYAEDDFLDSEASGDEDWNGNDVVEDGYAW